MIFAEIGSISSYVLATCRNSEMVVEGKIAEALVANAPTLIAGAPQINKAVILASKVRSPKLHPLPNDIMGSSWCSNVNTVR